MIEKAEGRKGSEGRKLLKVENVPFYLRSFSTISHSTFSHCLPSIILSSVIFYLQSFYLQSFYVWSFYIRSFYLRSFYVQFFYFRSWFRNHSTFLVVISNIDTTYAQQKSKPRQKLYKKYLFYLVSAF